MEDPKVIEKNLVEYLNQENPDKPYVLFKERYARFDFHNCEYMCEVKSRSNKHNQYWTTMVGYNKVKMAEEDEDDPNIKYRFYFTFTDGTYYWDFKKGEYKVNRGGIQRNKQYAFIPITHLKLLTTTIKSIS